MRQGVVSDLIKLSILKIACKAKCRTSDVQLFLALILQYHMGLRKRWCRLVNLAKSDTIIHS